MTARRQIKIAYAEYQTACETKKTETFKVVVVKNSTAYVPGQMLDRKDVDALCSQIGWDVTLVQLNREDRQ